MRADSQATTLVTLVFPTFLAVGCTLALPTRFWRGISLGCGETLGCRASRVTRLDLAGSVKACGSCSGIRCRVKGLRWGCPSLSQSRKRDLISKRKEVIPGAQAFRGFDRVMNSRIASQIT